MPKRRLQQVVDLIQQERHKMALSDAANLTQLVPDLRCSRRRRSRLATASTKYSNDKRLNLKFYGF